MQQQPDHDSGPFSNREPRFSTKGERGTILVNTVERGLKEKSRPCIHVHYLYFSVLYGSLNATCSIRKRRRQLRPALRCPDFHISLQSPLQLLNIHILGERSDTRAEFIGPGDDHVGREFTSAAGPLDGSSLRENYLVVIITGVVRQFVCRPIACFEYFYLVHLVLPEYIDKNVENRDKLWKSSLFILKYLQNSVIILMI